MRNWVLVMLMSSPVILSFSHKPGGEGYEIYLNDKVFTQQFGKDIDNVKSLTLATATANDRLVIKYHHCGRIGKNRVVSIRDAQNKILREFRYTDGSSSVSSMSVPVKDLMGIKGKNNEMKLFYTSTELPKGRVLLLIKPSPGNLVKL
jgi:hypothetical protein